MRKIYKYALVHVGGPQIEKIPRGYKILCVQVQNRAICMWCEVTPGEPLVDFKYEIVGTGWELDPSPRSYLGTYQTGSYVWHVYQLHNQYPL